MRGILLRHQINKAVKSQSLLVNRINKGLPAPAPAITSLICRQLFNSVFNEAAIMILVNSSRRSTRLIAGERAAKSGSLVKPGQKQLVFFHIANRRHLRQKGRRCPPANAQKHLSKLLRHGDSATKRTSVSSKSLPRYSLRNFSASTSANAQPAGIL